MPVYGTETPEVAALRAEVSRLRKEIGHPPEGSHPDEAKPRAATWHEERLNWIREVETLREHVKMVSQFHRL